MSNKSRGQRPAPGAFTQALKQAIEQSAERSQTAIGDEDEAGEVSGGLPKPNFQHIHANTISWQWNPLVGKISVEAVYDRKNTTYDVAMNVNVGKGGYDGGTMVDVALTADESKTLGETMLAAHQWAEVWQGHVGEFLVTADTPESTFEPVPGGDQEFVPDGEPVVSDTPVGPVVYDGQRLKSVQHIGVDGGIHPGPSHPCEPCDKLESEKK